MRPMLTNQTYRGLLQHLLSGDHARCRGHHIVESLGYQTHIPMSAPLVSLTTRKLSRRFAFAEAAWLMSGDNRVSTIKPFNSRIENFSDDGQYFYGAYGPQIVDQLPYILRAFKKDPGTRQAVLTIWRRSPPDTRDTPCTVSIQWIYRHGVLHCLDTMRSSDAWLGVPYDWFNFSMLSAGLALHLREMGMHVQLGTLVLTCGSQHLYVDKGSFGYDLDDVAKVVGGDAEVGYAPLSLSEFHNYDDLVAHLWRKARGQTTDKVWLGEFNLTPLDDNIIETKHQSQRDPCEGCSGEYTGACTGCQNKR
jgi:thymidylate synthase